MLPVEVLVRLWNRKDTSPPLAVFRFSDNEMSRKPANKGELTPKQELFVKEYLVDLNAARAYRVSHPRASERTSHVEGFKVLANPSVAVVVKEHRQQLIQKYDVTHERIVEEMRRVAFANHADYAQITEHKSDYLGQEVKRLRLDITPTDKLTESQTAAISEVSQTVGKDSSTIKFKLHDKRAALDSLARWTGLEKSALNPGDVEITEIRRVIIKA